MFNIFNKLKKKIKLLYPIYQSKNDIIVMKTISNLINGYILLNHLILKNVIIYVAYFNVSVNNMIMMSTINQKLNLISLDKFINDKYILFDDIKQIKERNCHYKSCIEFKLHLTRFQFKKLIYNNRDNLFIHRLLEIYIKKIYYNITGNTKIIINSYGTNKLEEFLNPFFACNKVKIRCDLYSINVILSQEYHPKVSIVMDYLKRLIRGLSEIVECLIANSEVKIEKDFECVFESDSESESDFECVFDSDSNH